MDPSTLSPARQRSLLLEYRFHIDIRNIDDACRKYELTRASFQRLRKELGRQFAGEEELVIAGVYEGAHTIESLRGYLDYRNHAGYRAAEVRAFIDNLVRIDVLEARGEEWRFAPGAPAAKGRYVFTAPPGAEHEPIHFGRQRHVSLR